MAGPLSRGPTLGQVITAAREHADTWPALSPEQRRVVHTLRVCRTAALGGQRYRCSYCGREHFVPHACGNRHCPHCQGAAAQKWLAQQEALLLPVPYFHLVFTLPHGLNPLIRQNRRLLYTLLFTVVSQTLLTFGRNRFGARVGITAVLHTWGQNLIDHYHLHCVVSGGGWDEDRRLWVRASGRYLFSVEALAEVFRAKYLAGLQRLYQRGKLEFHGQLESWASPAAFAALRREVSRKPWVVYAKRPFAGPEQVLRYVGRYTHRVAISPRRLLALDREAGTVRFAYRDNREGGRSKTMALGVGEFVRRFALHVLPEHFTKIRHYGLLANRGRQERLGRVRAALGVSATTPAKEGSPRAEESERELVCPHCGARALVWVAMEPRPERRSVPPDDTS
jgi:Putative transposase/Transposase zinc-binding domain